MPQNCNPSSDHQVASISIFLSQMNPAQFAKNEKILGILRLLRYIDSVEKIHMCIKAVPFAVGPKSTSCLSMYFFSPQCRMKCPHCGVSLPEIGAFTLHHPTPVQAAQTLLQLPILSQTPPTCPALPLAHLPPTAMVHYCHLCFILYMS